MVLIQRALAFYEKTLGPIHHNTATSMGNLGEVYRRQGEIDRAEPLLKAALAAFEGLDADQPSVATCLNNLAGIDESRGEYKEAAARLERAVAILDKAIGPDHPDTVKVRANLAALRTVLTEADKP